MGKRGRGASITVMVAVTLLLILLLAPGAQAAQSIPEAAAPRMPRSAPLSPDFVLWEATRSLDLVTQTADPQGLGLPPSPVRGYVATGPVAAPGVVTSYPAGYDLRTQGKLTAVRDQGAFGTCWTFAALGSLESSSLPGETLDLSEDNMVLTNGFDIGGASTTAARYANGGNLGMATAYLVRWGGPVYETDDTYGDDTTPAGLTSRRHVQDVDYYAGRTSATDNDRIKYAVSTHGGAFVTMCWDNASYNSATRAHYYTGDAGINHAVVVVGWNDHYAAGNFLTKPPGDGAFIVRNSWGSGWGEGGYFYVSYYDTRFACQYTSDGYTYPNDAASFEAARATTNYGTVYQYDPLGAVSALGYGAGDAAWGANVFTALSASALNAVGFYANAPDTAYEVWEGPSTSSLTRLTSGTLAQMGYHTVTVPAGTSMASGATFVVAVKLTTPGYAWPLSIESPLADYSSAAVAAAGQSYYSSDGSSWVDLTDFRANANACVKAYASQIPTSSCSYDFAANGASDWKTSAQTVTITASGGDGIGSTIYSSQDGGSTWDSTAGTTVDVSVSAQGAHHFEFYAKDSLARETTHDAGYVNVDTIAPVTRDDHLSASLVAPATITLAPSDATSGMSGGSARTEYRVDGAASYTTGTSIALATGGSHTVSYRSTDKAGNVESPDKTITVTVQGFGAPTSTSSYSFAADAASGWKKTAQNVSITASGGSGTGRTIHYTQDGGSTWASVVGDTADVSVTTQGAHHIEYYGSDSLAAETTHDGGWVNIDSVAPVTTDDHPVIAVMGPATITLTPSDATSGMADGAATTEYRIDDSAAYTTGTTVVLAEGTHTIAYRSTDAAGNVESPDKTCSVTVMNPLTPQSACGYVFAPDARSGWKNTGQTLTVTAAGGGGTGRTVHYSLDGGVTWSASAAASADILVATQGSHHIEFYGSDSLAAEAVHDAGWVNIDSAKPSTTATRATARKGRSVTLKFRVNDSLPGCGQAALKLQIRRRTRLVKTITLGTMPANAAITYRYAARLEKDTYTYRILATDIAGNTAAKMVSARLRIR